ncbi:neuronal acetylcholine receptor subunit alpha-3 [Lasius niger]|uniref:Neuronal acetylcholine receptor subunit alpha-3 n=1 Tax=Lasius niger TaxID=67767 RepID=A0A0J7NHV9_LASNI|nr:neuronal acetylcholine receptor subunit alpha-3 [Lasius niger]
MMRISRIRTIDPYTIKMRILQVFGFFIFWPSNSFIVVNSYLDIVSRKCKNVEDTKLPLLRLKRQLFCDYDSSSHPNHFKNNVTVVTLRLMPKLMELTWSDPHLTWSPSDYDGINFIHVKSSKIWTPDLCVYNSGDMLDDQLELPVTECLLFSEGSVSCVPAVKFVAKCDPDYTYFPYDKYICRITFGSWRYIEEEVDYQISRDGISMDEYENNTEWDFKFINAVKEIKTHKCCGNDTFSSIDYNFLLTRYQGRKHITIVIPAIALILLTLTVLCLDPKSMERFALASVNYICHLLCLYFVHWQLQYNGVNTPKIFIFYGESVALATFAIILTILLRKLEDMNTKMPNWISSTTMFILSNRAGRFLIVKDNETKMADENTVTEGNSNVLKSEAKMKEPSWRHFATIIDWLSFICVILTYIIMLIIFISTG